MNALELLPCPFCGDDGDKGRQTVTQMTGDRAVFDRIICRCCGAMAPELNWQKRILPPPQAERVPMTDAEIDLVRCNTRMPQSTDSEWMTVSKDHLRQFARAVLAARGAR